MTDTGSQEKPLTDEAAEATVAETPTPAPEPWTAERVFEWNSYYDLYVAAFVILLVFLGSAKKIPSINSGIWSTLQAGRQIVANGAPVVTDMTSIGAEGSRWVNIPWVYELTHYGLFRAASSFYKPDPSQPIPSGTVPSEQYGAAALIALDAFIRAMAALLLLGLRRKGPGLWWTALCVTMALGVTLGPSTTESFAPTAGGEVTRVFRPSIGLQIGGIAWPASVVAPETWGLFCLALELLLIHQAINLGKGGRLYLLIPLFLLWANVDESFGFGLVALAATVIGLVVDSKSHPSRPSLKSGLIVLAACFAATFVSPSHVFGVLGAFGTILRTIGLDVGPPSARPNFLFGKDFGASMGQELSRSFQLFYATLVGLGLASFALNRRKFVLSRFLTFAAASVIWALAFGYLTSPFALVLAATLALNGQEWYQGVFGVEGRLGPGWTVWSTGGRLVTIALTFLAITVGVTGWGSQMGDPLFGFGFNPDDFPFESAEALKDAPIEGSILNTSLAQGDAIAWRLQGKRKAYVDSRKHLYPRAFIEEWKAIRRSLVDDDIAKWQPVLDQFKISAVMIQLIGDPGDNAPKTYARLMNSPNWVPFYDDGAVVMFGRADAKVPPSDLAYFKANRLDAEDLVYKRPRLVPAWKRPPIATFEPIDSIFQNRLLNRPQTHIEAARRWLNPANAPVGQPYLPSPAQCLMAIREARTALSINPDDTIAFEALVGAYQRLLTLESALLVGIPLTTENIPKIAQTPPQSRFLANRFRQLLAAFNFRIATLPPAKTPEEKALKADLNLRLGQLYYQSGAFDLARERFHLLLADSQVIGMNEEFLKSLLKQIGDLNQQIEQIQTQISDLVINRKASPVEKADFARRSGAPGMAIHELEEANEAGGNLAGIRPTLVDLYCDFGFPDKAFDLIGNLPMDDPSLSTGTGTASYRQGKVYFLLGNYANTAEVWRERSIAQVRLDRNRDAPMAGELFLYGDPIVATKMFLKLPELVATQAEWEFELGLAALEGGLPPDFVAARFESALKLEPSLTVRPLIAYYLEKLGKAVPPPKKEPAKAVEPAPTATTTATPAVEPPKAADNKSELPAIPNPPEPPKP